MSNDTDQMNAFEENSIDSLKVDESMKLLFTADSDLLPLPTH